MMGQIDHSNDIIAIYRIVLGDESLITARKVCVTVQKPK